MTTSLFALALALKYYKTKETTLDAALYTNVFLYKYKTFLLRVIALLLFSYLCICQWNQEWRRKNGRNCFVTSTSVARYTEFFLRLCYFFIII